jgi:hypothetical protein
MSKLYIVKPGDTLHRIARRHGFRKWEDLYYHKENKGFRDRRPNPDRIYVFDVIVIPTGRAPASTPATTPEKTPSTPAWSISPDRDPSDVHVPDVRDLQLPQAYRVPPLPPRSASQRAQDVWKALQALKIAEINKQSDVGGIAKTIKSYMELKNERWVIKPDLGTIGKGLLELVQSGGQVPSQLKGPKHPIDSAVRGE